MHLHRWSKWSKPVQGRSRCYQTSYCSICNEMKTRKVTYLVEYPEPEETIELDAHYSAAMDDFFKPLNDALEKELKDINVFDQPEVK